MKRRPVIIEFSGLPNSGKTTLLHNLSNLSEGNNVKTIIVQEPAELLPKAIQKGSIQQNLWITLETLQRSLELSNFQDVDYVLLDRGFYNQQFWATMYEKDNPKYSSYVTKVLKEFGEMFQVAPDYLYVIDVEVEESIRRREANGEPVTFSKRDFLVNYRKKFEEFYSKIPNALYIDSTNLTEDEVAKIVFQQIITL